MAKNETEILKLRNLKKRFGVGDAENYALNGVDLKKVNLLLLWDRVVAVKLLY